MEYLDVDDKVLLFAASPIPRGTKLPPAAGRTLCLPVAKFQKTGKRKKFNENSKNHVAQYITKRVGQEERELEHFLRVTSD